MNTEVNQQSIMNERIEYRIPEGLILRKSTHPAERDVTIFDALAVYSGLCHVRRNIYVDAQKNEYIITKFGFRPAEQCNSALQVSQSKCENEILKSKWKSATKKVKLLEEALIRQEDQMEQIQAQQKANEARQYDLQQRENKLREKERELVERERKTAPFLIADNEVLRRELKKLTNERNQLRETGSVQLQPKNPVMMQATSNPSSDKLVSTDLDWTAFNDLLKQLVA